GRDRRSCDEKKYRWAHACRRSNSISGCAPKRGPYGRSTLSGRAGDPGGRSANAATEMNHVRDKVRAAMAACVAVVVALVVAATEARAQGVAVSASREQERATLYNDGLSLVEQGRWEEAMRKFDAVVAIR